MIKIKIILWERGNIKISNTSSKADLQIEISIDVVSATKCLADKIEINLLLILNTEILVRQKNKLFKNFIYFML